MNNISFRGWANANKRFDRNEQPQKINNNRTYVRNQTNEDKALDNLSKVIDMNTNKSIISNTKQDPSSIWGADTFEKWRVKVLERINSVKSITPVQENNILRMCQCGCCKSLPKKSTQDTPRIQDTPKIV